MLKKCDDNHVFHFSVSLNGIKAAQMLQTNINWAQNERKKKLKTFRPLPLRLHCLRISFVHFSFLSLLLVAFLWRRHIASADESWPFGYKDVFCCNFAIIISINSKSLHCNYFAGIFKITIRTSDKEKITKTVVIIEPKDSALDIPRNSNNACTFSVQTITNIFASIFQSFLFVHFFSIFFHFSLLHNATGSTDANQKLDETMFVCISNASTIIYLQNTNNLFK